MPTPAPAAAGPAGTIRAKSSAPDSFQASCGAEGGYLHGRKRENLVFH